MGAESRQVADDAAAKGDDVAFLGHPGLSQLAQDPLGAGHRLRTLPRLDLDPGGKLTDALAVTRADVCVGDAEAGTLERPPAGLEQAGPTKTGYSPEGLAAQSSLVSSGSCSSARIEGIARPITPRSPLGTIASASSS